MAAAASASKEGKKDAPATPTRKPTPNNGRGSLGGGSARWVVEEEKYPGEVLDAVYKARADVHDQCVNKTWSPGCSMDDAWTLTPAYCMRKQNRKRQPTRKPGSGKVCSLFCLSLSHGYLSSQSLIFFNPEKQRLENDRNNGDFYSCYYDPKERLNMKHLRQHFTSY